MAIRFWTNIIALTKLGQLRQTNYFEILFWNVYHFFSLQFYSRIHSKVTVIKHFSCCSIDTICYFYLFLCCLWFQNTFFIVIVGEGFFFHVYFSLGFIFFFSCITTKISKARYIKQKNDQREHSLEIWHSRSYSRTNGPHSRPRILVPQFHLPELYRTKFCQMDFLDSGFPYL